MRKVLVALFAMMILSIGVLGINKLSDEPVELIEQNSHSSELTFNR
ncbi:hypothetical protein [Oceanobacillus bengalensis]|nr:hypothetical protein [Oceanobacillus bengalensis]